MNTYVYIYRERERLLCLIWFMLLVWFKLVCSCSGPRGPDPLCALPHAGPNASNADRASWGGHGSLASNVADALPRTPRAPTANLRTKILDIRGLDSRRILMSRRGTLRPAGRLPEISSRRIVSRDNPSCIV